jgi:hypothetical protein
MPIFFDFRFALLRNWILMDVQFTSSKLSFANIIYFTCSKLAGCRGELWPTRYGQVNGTPILFVKFYGQALFARS